MNIDSYNDSLRIFDSYGVHLDISHYGIFFGGNSLNTNGYNRLNNNLILQWGYSGSRHTTFPVTFGTVLQVYAQYVGTAENTYNRDSAPINITNSGFDIYESNTAALPYRWWSVGI